MANTVPSMETLVDIFTCPVCLEKFDDPRILNCGHHFCLGCLDSICRRDCEGRVTCPSCRRDTELRSQGKGVYDLPRPVMVNELQSLLTSVMDGGNINTRDECESQKTCDLCSTMGSSKVVPAMWYCYQCKYRLCEDCCEKHKTTKLFSSHILTKASDHLFCTTHPREVFNAYCEECQVCVCNICVHADEHVNHDLVDVQEKAKSRKQEIEEFIRSESKYRIDARVFERIMSHVMKANENHMSLKNYLSKVKSVAKSMYDKVNAMETALDREMEEQSLRVTAKCEQMIKIDTLRATLLEYSKHVTIGRTDLDLVAEVPPLPRPAMELGAMDVFYDVCIPSLPQSSPQFNLLDQLHNIHNNIDNYLGFYNRVSSRNLGENQVTCKVGQLPEYGYGHFRNRCSIYLYPGISGITLDSENKFLLIRTRDKKNPIKVYDYDGIKLHEFGSGIAGLDLPGLLTKDSGLQVYLAPADDKILTIDPDGLENVPLIGKENVVDKHGASVSFQGARAVGIPQGNGNLMERVYAVPTADDSDLISFYRLVRGKAVKQATPAAARAENPGNQVFYIQWCGKLPEPGFVYTNQVNNNVKVISQDGTLKRCYGDDDVRLKYPCGVCEDRRGRIIVADWGNKRVLALWTENNENRSQCLIGQDSLQGRPYDISYDVIYSSNDVHEVLAVELEDRVVLYQHTEKLLD